MVRTSRCIQLAMLASVVAVGGCPTPDEDDDATADDDATSDDDALDDDSSSDDDTTGDDDSAPVDDGDGDGWTVTEGDCDDTDPSVHPEADEVLCDGLDSDCDGLGTGIAAVVDGMEFTSITAAMGAVLDGGTLQVCPGTHLGQLTIARDMTLTSFSGSPDDTILDGQDTQTVLHIEMDHAVTESYLTIQNGRGEPWIGGDYYGGGIMSRASTLTVEGCVFKGNEVADLAGKGGAVAYYRGSGSGSSLLRVDGCRFEENSASSSDGGRGGAISVDATNGASCSVELLDSSFVDNEAYGAGGAVWIHGDEDSPVDMSLNNCTFEGNRAETSSGGALYMSRWAALDVVDSVFTDNHSGYEGGAIRLTDATVAPASVTISGTDFDGNVATGGMGDGGALSISSDEYDHFSLCLDSVSFNSNETDLNGGAVFLGGDSPFEVQLTDVDFTGNFAANRGGAFQAGSDGDTVVQMDGGSFTGNIAEEGGSALYLANNIWQPSTIDVTLTGVLVEGNTVNLWDQGALWACTDNTTLVLDGCTVTSNDGGAANLFNRSDITVTSIDTDWGTLASDNAPYDVSIQDGATYDTYGANASFTCTGDAGCS